MEDLREALSLATFEPDKAYEPYLNTPRSLEACRMNGVNPIELVEIPVSEFQRDFPNDPDAAQRRFERVDGARRRMLAYVIRDWKQLCSSGWQPPRERPKSAKETIVQVSAGAHCTLLELQAQRFRKIEADNWDALNRQLKLELHQAELEQRNKTITQKHEEIQSNNDNLKRERQAMVERLHKEELERLKKRQEDEAAEVRRLQALESEAAKQKVLQDAQNRLKEKQARERRELERVEREQATKQLKNSILSGIEHQTEAKKRVLSIRDKNMQDRVEQTRREREQALERRRLEKEQRLAKAREDQQRQDELERQEMLDRIARNEEKRARLQDQRERERKEQNDRNDDATREKLSKIREASEGAVSEKAARTLSALQTKEELARQELQRVREAQEKRRCIKAIRQEAFKMASYRARKAEEYRMLKIAADLKNKEDRCNAIKKGFSALDHMRNSMKDIMEKTNLELKHELHQLRHKGQFSPDRVVAKALEVSNHVLFPKLERTFGIAPSPLSRAGTAALQGGAATLFPSDFASSGRGKSSGDLFFGTAGDGILPLADTTGAVREGGAAGAAETVTNPATSVAVASRKPSGAGRASSTSTGRKGFEPLPIHTMTQDRLQAALLASKSKVRDGVGSPERSGTWNSAEGRRAGTGREFEETGRFAFEDDEDGEEGPVAILKLPEDAGKARGKATSSLGASAKGGELPGGGNKGLGLALSPTTSQAGSADGHFLPKADGASPVAARARARDDSPVGNQRGRATRSASEKGLVEGRPSTNASASAEDVQLPVFKFDPLRSSEQGAVDAPDGGDGVGDPDSAKQGPPGHLSLSKKFRSSFAQEQRTDVNDRSTFLEPPPGKFRREFSLDHPLAKGGTGKYLNELKKGVTPAGLPVEVPEQIKRSTSNVAETLGVATKVERLTYSAQQRVVDPRSQIDQMKRQQNEALKRIIGEEREAEARREQTLRTVVDPRERQNLEGVFSEERRRASDRIIEATRQHEEAMKAAVLSMMDLGVGSRKYGKDDGPRLPMDISQ